MRNRYPGTCYRCGTVVEPGQGHFERHGKGWRVQHTGCAIIYRGTDVHYQFNPAPDKPRIGSSS